MILRKILLASPFALMMGLFNPLFEPQPLVELAGCTVAAGWVSFASIMIRFGLTVAAALVLVASTGFYQVCVGLGRLGLPLAV
jgi:cobalt/nickel transport system permease protein